MIDPKWLAGFIDGEGCFNFTKTRTTIYPRLIITNTNLGILLEIKEKYGGDITSRLLKIGWKESHFYRASCRAFKKILNDVYPYLKVKKEVATICVEALKTKDPQKRMEFNIKSKELNKKGSIAYSKAGKSRKK